MRFRPFNCLSLALIFFFSCSQPQPSNKLAHQIPLSIPQIKRISQEQYGIQVGSHEVLQDSFPKDQLLIDLLRSYGVAGDLIDTIDHQSGEAFDVRNMRAGQPYTILKNVESQEVDFFIYEETGENFVVIDLRQGVQITRGSQPVQTEVRSLYLPISTTLYDAVEGSNTDVALVKSLERIFAWQVDFFRLDAGDYCQVLFEERYVDGTFIGIGNVLASRFHHDGNDSYAFYHESDSAAHYYDQHGTLVRKAFLAAPIAGDMSSPVNFPSTFHRGSKEYVFYSDPKAAVLAVGSGKIVSIKHRRDGIAIFFQHSAVYSSEYLYLSALATGVGKSSKIMQGDTIGFVGASVGQRQTPGVGLRYWSHGKPVPRPTVQYDEESINTDLSDDDAFMRKIRNWRKKLTAIYPPSI